MTSDFSPQPMLKLAENSWTAPNWWLFCALPACQVVTGPKLLRCYATWHLAPRMPTWLCQSTLILSISVRICFYSVCLTLIFFRSLISSHSLLIKLEVVPLCTRYDENVALCLKLKQIFWVSEYYEDKYYRLWVGQGPQIRGMDGKGCAFFIFLSKTQPDGACFNFLHGLYSLYNISG